MTPIRIKTMTSYRAHAQFYAEIETGPIAYLARCQIADIKTPYRYSPTVAVECWQGKSVICLETAHRHFEVFEVSRDFLRFKTEQEAEDWHMRYHKAA